MRAEPSWVGLVSLEKRPYRDPSLPSTMQGYDKESVIWKRALTHPFWHSPDFTLSGLRNKCLFFIATQPVVMLLLPKLTKTIASLIVLLSFMFCSCSTVCLSVDLFLCTCSALWVPLSWKHSCPLQSRKFSVLSLQTLLLHSLIFIC